jgi:hypothetical protein
VPSANSPSANLSFATADSWQADDPQEKTKALVRLAARALIVSSHTLKANCNRVVYFRPRPLDVWLATLPRFSVLRCDEAVVGLLFSSGRSRCQG